MKKTLYEYKDKIIKLPIKDKYDKDEILTNDFLIEREKNIEIYYSPHNEYINTKAKIFIVGITPGFQQMSTAISAARKELENSNDIEEVQYKCKEAARFSGSLRKNLISMLDEIEINKYLDIDSCNELFGKKDYLLHTVSLIPYAVFVEGKNYSGHSPKLIKSEFLMKYVYENFIDELKVLDNARSILIIPLGKCVEEVLYKLEEHGIINENQILKGFPHPSGANVNMRSQFEKNKEMMIQHQKILKY
ncbi:hypothetical protein [Clostridium saccharobutylicum]|uniref:YoxB n=1 Tax=Clostridium saccharobutylicum DSM 13864 TaxID=1345695 RepID=U5MYW2_CLOSA|nr:hypothetical protein [Clostridium saccharobutylicum]AGX44692.1 hypothetical protein CLSA_c37310 [Clostridium saccharobutylicum DSM 13864]AQR91981.1 hypothetical protein CLOSC_37090 [Clostridium saccharobutylicum]AQS01883.1 hypothetical protein CSACC_37140 [Clostridium saccharobutylicum]AQS11483.1 hypothetical protein CLOBY_36390 [Clostridium saccharobutylicum]AQS15866.1 hypothetical protein CLOSACC_37140 [Clostridium saccharobutylicum]